ncbi:MAG TPA: hypothetical protein VF121_15400 [Thermoanaerobaculia bacterium]|nr:hypothetical protein [Thermoanaerobaculia bacterium]
MPPLQPLFARVALALIAAHLAVALPLALGRSAKRLVAAARQLDETPAEARRRVFGAAYVAAIEEARRAIPVDGIYLLVDAQSGEEGAQDWVRFDLAPRRALFLGKLADLPPPAKLKRRLPGGARVVVLATGNRKPPRVLDRASFVRSLEGRSE